MLLPSPPPPTGVPNAGLCRAPAAVRFPTGFAPPARRDPQDGTPALPRTAFRGSGPRAFGARLQSRPVSPASGRHSLLPVSLFAFPGPRLRAGGAPANGGTVKSVNGMKIHFALFMFFTFFTVERKAPSGMRPSCWTWLPHIRAARLGAKKGDGAARPERNRRAVGRVSKKGPHAAPSACLTEERCSHSARPARRAVRRFTAQPPRRDRGCPARRRASPGRRSRRTGPRGGRPWRGRRAGARRPGRRRGRGSP